LGEFTTLPRKLSENYQIIMELVMENVLSIIFNDNENICR
jgi:hypothetical protein